MVPGVGTEPRRTGVGACARATLDSNRKKSRAHPADRNFGITASQASESKAPAARLLFCLAASCLAVSRLIFSGAYRKRERLDNLIWICLTCLVREFPSTGGGARLRRIVFRPARHVKIILCPHSI